MSGWFASGDWWIRTEKLCWSAKSVSNLLKAECLVPFYKGKTDSNERGMEQISQAREGGVKQGLRYGNKGSK